MRIHRVLTTAGAGLAAVALLAGCATEENPDNSTVESPTSATTAESAPVDNTDDATGTEETSGTDDQGTQDTSESTVSGDDPVFDIIDTVLAEYPDGIIVDIDREDRGDRGDRYEVEVVVGNDVLELDVTPDGQIREDDRDNDEEDDIREAQQATVTIAEAITEALSQHEDAVFDEAELDEDKGQLFWEIDLDDQDGRDLAELNIPAN